MTILTFDDFEWVCQDDEGYYSCPLYNDYEIRVETKSHICIALYFKEMLVSPKIVFAEPRLPWDALIPFCNNFLSYINLCQPVTIH